MNEELHWRPKTDDPAFMEGYDFVERNKDTASGYCEKSPWWWGWMVRQAFWCGVRWERRKRALPVFGEIGEGGKVTLK